VRALATTLYTIARGCQYLLIATSARNYGNRFVFKHSFKLLLLIELARLAQHAAFIQADKLGGTGDAEFGHIAHASACLLLTIL
jgi:hypothetical protein